MKMETGCLSVEELEALAIGKTLAADLPRIEGHLAQCASCRARHDAVAQATLAIRPQDRPPSLPEMKLWSASYSFLPPPVERDEIARLGRYRVLSLLAKGGMGLVFLAEDMSLARPVALKVMRPEIKGDPDGWKRFLLEARSMASIKHEHLVTVYHAGQEGDVAYFAMELLEGESLAARMLREPRPGIAEIIRIGREIAAGLAFVHQKNMLHRDLKPANIWLEQASGSPAGSSGRVKILDLGLVRPITGDSSLTATGLIMGTPDYMSPEQARGDTVDARSDLFSLGCVLYFMCTGRKPFDGATSSAVLMALASETPIEPCELNRQVPQALSDLVMKLLARNPKKRPVSADVVLERLRAIEAELTRPADEAIRVKGAPQSDEAIQTGAPDDGAARKRRARKHASRTGTLPNIQKPRSGGGAVLALTLVGIAALVVLSLGGGLAFWFFGRGQAQEQLPDDKVFLSELKEIARENWPHKKGGKDDKGQKKKGPPDADVKVRVQGKLMDRGIFMHPPVPPLQNEPASLTYRLQKKFRTFESDVTLNDGPEKSEAPCTFRVFGDGKELWKSNPVSSQADTQKCKISVAGVDELKIAVTCDGPPKGAHAAWIEPFISK